MRNRSKLHLLFIICSVLIMALLNGVALAKPLDITPQNQKAEEKVPLLKSDKSGTQILDGGFFQPELVVNWKDSDFSAEYAAMKDVAMNHVIWQWTVDSNKRVAYYPTNLPGFSRASSQDLVGLSLQEAEKKGLKVWLGLNWNSIMRTVKSGCQMKLTLIRTSLRNCGGNMVRTTLM